MKSQKKEDVIIRVASTSDPMKVAGAIRKRLTAIRSCEVHVVGNKATLIAVRALTYLTERFHLKVKSEFRVLEFLGKKDELQYGTRIIVSL